jgi:hypothetical protein
MSNSIDNKVGEYYQERRNRIWNTAEQKRLVQYMKYLNNYDPAGKNWRKWGCYLSERQWGTVRENYNTVENSWGDKGQPATFPRDQALHRAYRWGEDGIAGISDDHQYLCFALALWNGADPCLKERLYCLANGEGVHGEDVKEYYYYLDNTPTHSFMKYLYKYPYIYPYHDLYDTNIKRRNESHPYEYELDHTGAFADNRYFDVWIEYAKDDVEDMYIKITARNCGPEPKVLHLLPTVWFRNTWDFKETNFQKTMSHTHKGHDTIEIVQYNTKKKTTDSQMWLYTEGNMQEILFTENETDHQAAFGSSNNGRTYFKNGINNYLLGKYRERQSEAEFSKFINLEKRGTKAAVHYELRLNPGEAATVRLRLSNVDTNQPFERFDSVFDSRVKEADEFYDVLCPYDRRGNDCEKDLYNIQRQAFAGMLWNKQLYHLVVKEWLDGDPKQPQPSEAHQNDRKMVDWKHLYSNDILSMPDKLEYPWFASWDLAFHTVTLGLIDPQFAKHQLLLLVMEWFMHPNGQIPAFELDFSNKNPPVHAWAALKIYQQEQLIYGEAGDKEFLGRIFDKLNLNFTWWINRVDAEGRNIFGGGFLGLDNIRIMELSETENQPRIEQTDGTAWMAMFCLNMMKIANELGKYDLERKYLQHFIYICDAINSKIGLWDEERGFYFDWVKTSDSRTRLEVYSLVGLVPLFAIEELKNTMGEYYEKESFFSLNGTLKWFKKNRPELIRGNPLINLEDVLEETGGETSILEGYISMVDHRRLRQIMEKVLNNEMFLSDFGIRSLAKNSDFTWNGSNVSYEPAESNKVKMMGGNSNWRGPIWMCINYLLIDSLWKFHAYLGDDYLVTYAKTREEKNLSEVCTELSNRLIKIFRKGPDGQRPVFGGQELFNRPGWNDYPLFYEYFHGDNAAGLGASHQTGWTGLIANLIQETGVREKICAQATPTGVPGTDVSERELVGATH